MASDIPGMVIVGAGECGTRAALALREQGYAGPVTLIGAERHHPYERPPLSKGLGSGAADLAPKEIVTREGLAALAIDWIAPAEAQAIDRPSRVVRLGNGRSVSYDALLLATGASPRRLALVEGSVHCATLRTLDDALAIRRRLGPGTRLAVIGGGFIGLELAAAARETGAAVTVVETQPRILGRGVPAEIASLIHARHLAHGVRILCGQGLTAITDRVDGVSLTLADGETVAADLAVVGIGAVPNTALAAAAGLPIDNGIAVDGRLRTIDPHIFAAGDCCSFPLSVYGGRRVRLEAWRNAQEHGTFVAGAMLGRDDVHTAVPWFWSDQYDLGLQVAGLLDEATDTVRRDLGPDTVILFHRAADGRLVAASGLGLGTGVAREIRLAEMLIAAGARPSREDLASPAVRLKALLAAAPARSDAA